MNLKFKQTGSTIERAGSRQRFPPFSFSFSENKKNPNPRRRHSLIYSCSGSNTDDWLHPSLDKLRLQTNTHTPQSTKHFIFHHTERGSRDWIRERERENWELMAGIWKQPGAFAITPHKVSLCILLKIYAPPAQISVPFPFSSVAQHNRLGLFLLALTKVQFLNSSNLINQR